MQAIRRSLTFDEEFKFWTMFDRKFKQNGSLDYEPCWLPITTKDRASFTLKGKRYKASRISYFLHYKVDPGDNMVLHKCESNGRCVNPLHLKLGNDSQNKLDRFRTEPPVITKGNAKINREIADEIRQFAIDNPTWTQEQIGFKFNLSQGMIGLILRREAWND